jgi:predicted transcriptional regulator
VVVELPEDLGVMLDQIALLEKVPKKTTIRKALEELREEIRERGIGVLFEEGEPVGP